MKRKKAIFFVLFGSDLGGVCVCVCARACVRAGEGRGATITDRPAGRGQQVSPQTAVSS